MLHAIADIWLDLLIAIGGAVAGWASRHFGIPWPPAERSRKIRRARRKHPPS